MNVFDLTLGTTPLLVSLPHVGTALPAELMDRYVPEARELDDTDWHLERLYDFAMAMGASVLTAKYSRYVIDLNRPPDDQPMYPGANNTELCPTRFFTGEPLYRTGQEPDRAEIERRRETYWQPYHAALANELQRLRVLHGHAILLDGHSIRSVLPWLFPGRLPDLNLGSAEGRSCSPGLRDRVMAVLGESPFSLVCDQRFKGGYITRHYGKPSEGLDALQLELCQCLYMQETRPYLYGSPQEPELRQTLRRLLQMLVRA